MSARITFASLATAFVLGAGALIGGSLATATSVEAKPFHGKGWHGKHHGHFGHGFGHRRHFGWGYRPFYAGGYYGCYKVWRSRFVPGVGRVVRPVTICR